MGATAILREEWDAFVETLETVGPDGPTLCDDWLTADLAAHVLLLASRPDAALGVSLGGPFARHTRRVMQQVKERGFDGMLERLRAGPPWHFRHIFPAIWVLEVWTHHEDARRAAGYAPRPSTSELDDVLWQALRLPGRLAVRKLRSVGVEIEAPDGRRRVLRRAEPMVGVRGGPGELVLFLTGRKESAEVELSGPPEAVALVIAARMGL